VTPARILAVIGAAFATITTLLAGMLSPGALMFALWALAPYAVLLAVERHVNGWMAGGAAAAALAMDIGIRAGVFLFPSGSTSALALIFSPMWIGAIAMPAGATLGWLAGRAWPRVGPPIRSLMVVAAAIIFATVVVGFARPDLLPHEVAKRNRALAALGDPRIVTGADAFTQRRLSTLSAWHQAGELDGVDGDEIAIVTHDGAELLDAGDLKAKATVTFGGKEGDLWNWYTRLVRIGGELQAVHTGGGYSDVGVVTLENQWRWRYQPEALVPSALLPADLDRDGITEFYASTSHRVSRLDGNGQVVWSRPATLITLFATAPSADSAPGVVVGQEHLQTVKMWDSGGNTIVDLPSLGDPAIAVVNWRGARHLVTGGRPGKVFTLDGKVAHTIEVDEGMALHQAVSFSWHVGAAPMLALVFRPIEDIERWRVRILDEQARIVYDEVLDHAVTLHTAVTNGGRATMLVAGNGLRALTPVDR
jgi:hypothetical protein